MNGFNLDNQALYKKRCVTCGGFEAREETLLSLLV